MATDMSHHGKILGDFKERVAAGAYPEGVKAEDMSAEDRCDAAWHQPPPVAQHATCHPSDSRSYFLRTFLRMLLCMMTLKCADISNVCRTFDVAAKWTDRIAEEFLAQVLGVCAP